MWEQSLSIISVFLIPVFLPPALKGRKVDAFFSPGNVPLIPPQCFPFEPSEGDLAMPEQSWPIRSLIPATWVEN